MTQSLTPSAVVDITVSKAGAAVAGLTYNRGLILTPEAWLPSYGARPRVRMYTADSWSESMLTDGATTTSPSYLAAQLYFADRTGTSKPKYVYIGRKDNTAVQTATVDAAGENYVLNDLLTIVQTGASYAVLRVTGVSGSGGVTSFAYVTRGTGYSAAAGLSTTGGSGSGCTISVSAIGESYADALTACNAADGEWYGFGATDATDADYAAIAAWAEAASPEKLYFMQSADAAVLNGTADNVFKQLQAQAYQRTMGLYITTQGGLYPNNAYAWASLMGFYMGANTGAANSNFSPIMKTLPGVAPESLDAGATRVIAGYSDGTLGAGGNVYTSLDNGAGTYNTVFYGHAFDGSYTDQTVQVDTLVGDIRTTALNLLKRSKAVGQTNAGQTKILSAITAACERARVRGAFNEGGAWSGDPVLSIAQGTKFAKGYRVVSDDINSLSAADRAARKSATVYVAVMLAGAVQCIIIAVNVQE